MFPKTSEATANTAHSFCVCVCVCYLAELCDDAEGVSLQEAVVEGEDGRVVQLRQQVSFLRGSDRLVRSKVTERNLLQHLPDRDTETRVRGQRSDP